MKTLSKALLALITTSVIATTGNAALFQNANGTNMTGQRYVGIKAGTYNVSPANKKINNDNDNPTAYGLFGGYQYDTNWGVEGEYVRTGEADYSYGTTIKDLPVYTEVTIPGVPAVVDASGNVTTPATPSTSRIDTAYESKDIRIQGNIKGETLGLYGTYKYDFPNTAIYVKGKLGIAQNKLKFDIPNYTVTNSKQQGIRYKGSQSSIKESGIAGGVGVGYHLSPAFAVEAEYSVLPKIEDSESDLITLGAKMKF